MEIFLFILILVLVGIGTFYNLRSVPEYNPLLDVSSSEFQAARIQLMHREVNLRLIKYRVESTENQCINGSWIINLKFREDEWIELVSLFILRDELTGRDKEGAYVTLNHLTSSSIEFICKQLKEKEEQ